MGTNFGSCTIFKWNSPYYFSCKVLPYILIYKKQHIRCIWYTISFSFKLREKINRPCITQKQARIQGGAKGAMAPGPPPEGAPTSGRLKGGFQWRHWNNHGENVKLGIGAPHQRLGPGPPTSLIRPWKAVWLKKISLWNKLYVIWITDICNVISRKYWIILWTFYMWLLTLHVGPYASPYSVPQRLSWLRSSVG